MDETVDTDLRFYKYMADWRETEKTREGENVCMKHRVQKPARQDLTINQEAVLYCEYSHD